MVNGVPVKLYMTSVVTMLSATIIAVRELRLLPPSLKTDRVNEKNQAELLKEVEQMGVEIERIVTEDETDEQYPGESERHALHLQLAKAQA